MRQALLAHRAQSQAAPRLRGTQPDRRAVDLDGAFARREPLARERIHQLLLAVAGDTGDAHDLPASDFDVDVGEVDAELFGFAETEAPDAEAHAADAALAAMPHGGQAAAQHHFGDAGGAFPARVAACDHPAGAQHGGPAAQGADLLQLVGDVEDRTALRDEPAQRRKQRLDFLRRQHGGWLVHDQEAGGLQETAHDFNALAFAHR
jgi:hypothetical protein